MMEVTKVWWDGERLMAEPIDPASVYKEPEQPAQQEPVAWQVEMFIAGEWVPLGNPQRSKTKAEALASNPSLPKEHQRLFPVYTSPSPQRKPLTDEMAVAAARVLSDRQAAACNVDCGDMWKMHGNDFLEDARAALEAAHSIKGEA